MSSKAAVPEKTERLKIVVLDDDRLSSHNLSIQFKFVGETPMVATSDNWQQLFGLLAQRNELGNVLAIAIGIIKGDGLVDLLLQLHLHYPQLAILLLTPVDAQQLTHLPDTLRSRLLMLGERALNYQLLTAALQTARQLAGHHGARQQSRLASSNGTPLFRSLSGDSARIQQVRQLMLQVARRPATVLITGESGTGKEIVARNLHYHGGRGDKPFIVINCAAVAAERFDGELFGHERGYAGMKDGSVGLLEKADGGTLFLDEVSELPLHVQGKLLRFLEDKTLQRIGSSEPLTVDVRVVAGSCNPLPERVRKGQFREDLYYRLSVVPIELPALRERREDIPVLVNELIASLEGKGYETVRFNSSAIESLQQHDWPGNVRELANLVERLGIMQPNAVIGSNDLPPQYRYKLVEARGQAAAAGSAGEVSLATVEAAAATGVSIDLAMLPLDDERLGQYLANFERQLLAVALEDAAGLLDYGAERVQLDGASFRARLQHYGLLATPA